MRCRYDYQSELETMDEFEFGQEEFESDSGEFEEPEFEFEDESRAARILRPPRVGDDSAFRMLKREFEFEDEEELDQEVFGEDTRKAVVDTTVIPFRFICHLSVGFLSADKTPASSHASGTLIGRRHVLTAGHVFDSATLQGKLFKVAVLTATPGRNSAHPKKDQWMPFGFAKMKSYKVHPKWASGQDWEYDYALVTLDSDIGAKKFKSLGNAPLGCWGLTGKTSLTPLSPDSLKKKIVNMGGYPVDKCGKDAWADPQPCDWEKKHTAQFISYDVVVDPSPASEPKIIHHKADLRKGQSGAPLWRWDKSTGIRSLVGVQSWETSAVNGAVRYTAEMMKNLKDWGWKA